jgi:integrase
VTPNFNLDGPSSSHRPGLQSTRLLDQVRERIARGLYDCGLRHNEALKLRLKDVDVERPVVVRSGIERRHHLYPQLMQRHLKSVRNEESVAVPQRLPELIPVLTPAVEVGKHDGAIRADLENARNDSPACSAGTACRPRTARS